MIRKQLDYHSPTKVLMILVKRTKFLFLHKTPDGLLDEGTAETMAFCEDWEIVYIMKVIKNIMQRKTKCIDLKGNNPEK